MNQQLAMEFIRQRMNEMGVKNFHFEILLLFAHKTAQTFKLYNEFWYLLDWTQNLSIVSDTTLYNYTTTSLTLTSLPEFTGDVKITHALFDNQPVQFIRVIILES